MNEDIKEFINMIESLSLNAKTTRFLIIGKPEPIERIKNLINENEELLYEYSFEFEFSSYENLSKEYDDQVTILPMEMKPLIIKFIDDKTIIEEVENNE